MSQSRRARSLMDLKQGLEKLPCHFTWDLSCSTNELRELLGKLNDMDQQTCPWLVHYYNLMGFIQQALGSNTEALENLQKAESVIQEQGTEEAEVRLMVNKANLAWVYFHLGEMDNSTKHLEEVKSLQRRHPAPPGCSLHPEVSGEKGWALLKFDSPVKKQQSVEYFRMALKAEPERKKWHRGLAIALSKKYTESELTLEEIVEQLKIAHEKEPDSLFLKAQYLEKLSELQSEKIEREMESLIETFLDTGNLESLGILLKYYRNNSKDKAILEAERARKMFPTLNTTLKHLANSYKQKVYRMEKGSEEQTALASKSIKLFEEVVRHHPDLLRERVDLAAMYYYAKNNGRADEIYQQLLAETDLSPERQQYIYYCYACYLFHSGRAERSIRYHMKAAEIPGDSDDKAKSINNLKSIVKKGKNPLCQEILDFLKKIN